MITKEKRYEGSIAAMQALRVIFAHEQIPYQTGVGPRGPVVIVEGKYIKESIEKIGQWQRAVTGILY